MTKKVLNYLSLAVGCCACVAAVFYLINTILTATGFDWTEGTVKTYIYIGLVIVVLAAATVGLALGGVKLVQAFVAKKDAGTKVIALTMAVYFAAEVILAGLWIGFFDLGAVRSWIFAVLGIAGLVVTLLPVFGKVDEKNTKLVLLVAAILGFVLTIVDLVYSGGVGAVGIVFLMFMYGCATAIYVTYVVVEGSNAPKAETKEVEETKEEKTEE